MLLCRKEATDLAEEDRLRRVCRVHRVLLHPAGPHEAPLWETPACVSGAGQAALTLQDNHAPGELQSSKLVNDQAGMGRLIGSEWVLEVEEALEGARATRFQRT